MMRFVQRPKNGRKQFEAMAKPHQDALAEMKDKSGEPDHPRINQHVNAKVNQIWGTAKTAFMSAQNRKCGFCEVKITESTGDVEHYRPKNAVWKLKTAGRELNDSVNVRGRSYNKTFSSGYWWLAYSWENYLLACPTCNQRWKSALFPIAKPRSRAPRPGDENSESPLLLDPFGAQDPVKHLAFDDLGQIETYQGSIIGSKTIETCGLDRESLRSSRHEKAVRAHRLIVELDSESNPASITRILKDILTLGDADYVHSGMVRSIFEQGTNMAWHELEELFATGK